MLKRLAIIFFALGIIFLSTNADAEITEGSLLNGFSGWTELSDCSWCDSIVNFSVYKSGDSDWTDDSFFLNVSNIVNMHGNTLDVGAKYVYMYQIVNTNPSGAEEADLQKFSLSSGPVTSGGYFDNTVFYDSKALIDGVNWSLSIPNPEGAYPGDDYIDPVTGLGDGQPSMIVDPSNVSLATDISGSRKNPFSLYGNHGGCPEPSAPCDVMIYNFPTEPTNTYHIQPGEYSSVLFLTADLAPEYRFSETESGQGTGADGEIPAVVPEPISSTLFIFGAMLLGFRRFRRK